MHKLIECSSLSVVEDIMLLEPLMPGAKLAPLLRAMLDREENVYLSKYESITTLTSSTQTATGSFFNPDAISKLYFSEVGGRDQKHTIKDQCQQEVNFLPFSAC